MKFGQRMLEAMDKEWEPYYMRYNLLKQIIKKLEEKHVASPQDRSYLLSISIPPSTNAAAQPEGSLQAEDAIPMQEEFFRTLEKDMKCVQEFTDRRLRVMREMLERARQAVKKAKSTGAQEDHGAAKVALNQLGEEVLRLEKFVNLNFTGFQKILKKHDKRLPSPCRAFYTKRLQAQPWVRISITEIIGALGELYADLRGDTSPEASPSSSGPTDGHTRNVIKRYWLRLEDVTHVQTRILQHLMITRALEAPESSNTTTGAQLTTTLYLDNLALELYQARVEDSPGVSSIQLRWYDTAKPTRVVVERKANVERSPGVREVAQDSFSLNADEVASLFGSNFSSSEDTLVEQVVQAIHVKHLVPTARVQCMRTTFANPGGSLVVTLDTNMAMVLERNPDFESVDEVAESGIWFRDPTKTISADQIRQFPLAIMEVRVKQDAGEDTVAYPEWLETLTRSPEVKEVVGFSPYVHAVALLLPEDVKALPGWAGDSSLGSATIWTSAMGAPDAGSEEDPSRMEGASRMGTPVIDSDGRRRSRIRRLRIAGMQDEEEDHPTTSDVCERIFCGCLMEDADVVEPQILQGEMKVVLANERTFLRQLHVSIPLAAVGTSAMAAGSSTFVELSGGVLLLVVLLYVVVVLRQHMERAGAIRHRTPVHLESFMGPLLITGAVVASVLSYFGFVVLILSSGDDSFDGITLPNR